MAKKLTKKSTAKPTAKKKTATPRTKPELVTAKLTPIKTKSTATIASKGTRRPPLTPSIPHQVIDEVISDLTSVKNNLDAYAACQKAFGFLARSLCYAQTPHFKSWSFAEGKTPKLSGAAG